MVTVLPIQASTRGPRPTRARARRAVLWSVALFVLGDLGGSMLVDRMPGDLRFPEAGVFMSWAAAMPHGPDVLLLGSSRLLDVRPARIQAAAGEPSLAVLNASAAAGDATTFDYLLARFIAAGRTPRLCIVELNPEALARNNRMIGASLTRFFTWTDVARYGADLVRAGELNAMIGARLAPFYRYRAALLEWMTRAVVGQRARSAAPPPVADEERAVRADPDAEPVQAWLDRVYASWMVDYEVGGASVDALWALLDRARRNDVTVVLVGMPAATIHRRLQTPAVERRFQAHVAAIAKAYDTTFIDFRDRLDDGLFRDRYHFTPAGARAFGEILGREVVAPRLQRAGGPESWRSY